MAFNSQLPDKLSGLIELALSDLEKAERSPDYSVDMSRFWHAPSGGACAVCLAGSVMAFSLQGDKEQWLYPSSYPRLTREKLLALNFLRKGMVRQASIYLNKGKPVVDYRVIPEYSKRNRKKFRASMNKLSDDLRAQGE